MPAFSNSFAPAKINLFLHIVGRRNDGLHDLQSLFVFASVGDQVTITRSTRSDETRLSVSGPFAGELAVDNEDNLVLKAARLLEQRSGISPPPVAIALEKNLPVASGLGGGSGDAAATLRALSEIWDIDIGDGGDGGDGGDSDIAALALELGADVPACLSGRSAWVEGVGERVTEIDPFPEIFALLVNPRVGLSTADVFAAYAATGAKFTDPIPRWQGGNFDDLMEFLKATRNDLEIPARRAAPVINDVVAEISRTDNCILARMSGSGATCFGLFETQKETEAAAVDLASEQPGWWVRAARLGAARNAGSQA